MIDPLSPLERLNIILDDTQDPSTRWIMLGDLLSGSATMSEWLKVSDRLFEASDGSAGPIFEGAALFIIDRLPALATGDRPVHIRDRPPAT